MRSILSTALQVTCDLLVALTGVDSFCDHKPLLSFSFKHHFYFDISYNIAVKQLYTHQQNYVYL